MPRAPRILSLVVPVALFAATAHGAYDNFEVSHVHPIALTPSGGRLLAINTPDAILEVFDVSSGRLIPVAAVPVGLEPVTVRARNDAEAWVVNHLSDSISIVDLGQGVVVDTLRVGNEPTDIAFAGGKAFVALSGEDLIRVYDLADLDAAPIDVAIFSRNPRALAVANDGTKVYAVALNSGNLTSIVNGLTIFDAGPGIDPVRAAALGIDDLLCSAPPPPYPDLPAGIVRNPALTDPPSGIPEVGLIVRWDEADNRWEDEDEQDWSACLPFRLPDHDLFEIDVAGLTVTREVDHLGTTLFEVSVNPANGRIYVPNTDARNFVRFVHPLGVSGHVVDNRLSVVDPAGGWSVGAIALNSHVDRGTDPETNLAERLASISQPGHMVWKADGSAAYMTAIGSRKLFRVDGGCTDVAGSCIFGPDRSGPAAVEVGHGPTGVALDEVSERLYVLNRIDNSVAVVDEATLAKLGEVPLHDPSATATRDGRRFLYDAIIGSGHGDAACSSCHISGDDDGLAWDLGNPEGDMVPYSNPNDNVRFISVFTGAPIECDPVDFTCASHEGFDPQKGPFMTQTLRGMLEPLHWRGDQPTMNGFNPAFVALLGAADVGPVAGQPAGLSAVEMETFRQFALAIRYPPNPYRNLDDTLPDEDRPIVGTAHVGNPTSGLDTFDNRAVDGINPCQNCHAPPYGAAGGTLGGVEPLPVTSLATAALFRGDGARSPHNDIKIGHLRDVYTEVGLGYGVSGTPDAKMGFGLSRDGSIPNLLTFLSGQVFSLSPADTAREPRDVAAFVQHFPTGTKPCIGQQVTLPGTPAEEALLPTLLAIADRADPDRHGELVAYGPFAGRVRAFHLSGGMWVPDLGTEAPITTTALRAAATGPITFMCAPADSGVRLGGDRDEDTHRNGDDCAPAEGQTWAPIAEVVNNLRLAPGTAPTELTWDGQSGPGLGPIGNDIVGGLLSELHTGGLAAATACVAGSVPSPSWDDGRPDPPAGDGYYYMLRARNACGPGDFGPGRGAIEGLDCR